MIKWNKIEAGDYRSDDNRFHIIKTWDQYLVFDAIKDVTTIIEAE